MIEKNMRRIVWLGVIHQAVYSIMVLVLLARHPKLVTHDMVKNQEQCTLMLYTAGLLWAGSNWFERKLQSEKEG